jgi:Na+:H+ antiporter
MTIDVYLSVFSLMLISLGVNVLALRTGLPYTVLLVVAGSLLVPLSDIEMFSFVTSFQLTPELLFFIFLPILIFESAYNIKIRNLKDNKYAISMLAIVGLLISTFFIGFVGHWVLQLIGFQVPVLVTLIFGAIISATDPVAVLSLFKECGVPHRLTLIFEGESLFNDGTAFAVFFVLLEIMEYGYHGFPTVLVGVMTFFTMILGGILFGLFMGFLFSKLIELVRGHEHLEITLTLLVAHFTFLLTEILSETLVIKGFEIHLSSIISTLVSSLVLGNYGRYKMSAGVEEYMEKFWGYFAFLANSLVFLLMGLLFTNLVVSSHVAVLPIICMMLVVVVARGVSIYLSIGFANQIKSEESIPMPWQHLLSWGSLRGSLAVIMVLLIPDDLTLPNWYHENSIKDFIIATTIGSIYLTLLFKATTIEKMVQWLKIDALLPYEALGYYKSKALIYRTILSRIEELYQHQQISREQFDAFIAEYRSLHKRICKECEKQDVNSRHIVENMLRIFTLAMQKAELKEIFRRNEINEIIYKKNLTILETQTERVEQDKPKLSSLNAYFFSWFGNLSHNAFFRRVFFLRDKENDPQELYLYYRTQYKLISKVLDELYDLENTSLAEVFDDSKAVQNVIAIYLGLKRKTEREMQYVLKTNQELLDELNEKSAEAQLQEAKNQSLKELHDSEIISGKLYVLLSKEMND